MAKHIHIHVGIGKTRDADGSELLDEQRRDLTKISSRLASIGGNNKVNPGYQKAASKAEKLIDEARNILFRARLE